MRFLIVCTSCKTSFNVLSHFHWGWVNLSGGGVEISGLVKKTESRDFRSPEVGISVIMSKSQGVLPYKSDEGTLRTF